jgi:hypothetical protein
MAGELHRLSPPQLSARRESVGSHTGVSDWSVRHHDMLRGSWNHAICPRQLVQNVQKLPLICRVELGFLVGLLCGASLLASKMGAHKSLGIGRYSLLPTHSGKSPDVWSLRGLDGILRVLQRDIHSLCIFSFGRFSSLELTRRSTYMHASPVAQYHALSCPSFCTTVRTCILLSRRYASSGPRVFAHVEHTMRIFRQRVWHSAMSCFCSPLLCIQAVSICLLRPTRSRSSRQPWSIRTDMLT